jgi:hypothetical protein
VLLLSARVGLVAVSHLAGLGLVLGVLVVIYSLLIRGR